MKFSRILDIIIKSGSIDCLNKLRGLMKMDKKVIVITPNPEDFPKLSDLPIIVPIVGEVQVYREEAKSVENVPVSSEEKL